MNRLSKKIRVEILIAACAFSSAITGYGAGTVSAATAPPPSATETRDAAYAYVVGSIDAMTNGAYEQYLQTFINNDNPPEDSGPEGDGKHPITYYKFWGLNDTQGYINSTSEAYSARAFCSDLIYMEYPYYWYMGSNDFCSSIFYHYSEEEMLSESVSNWKDFMMEELKNSEEQVKNFIQAGGIGSKLEEALGYSPYSPGAEYRLELEEAQDPIMFYSLKRGDTDCASIVIWRNLGKMSIRNEERVVTVERKKDYGRIMLFHEWDRVDFSSQEAVKNYVQTNQMKALLDPVLKETVTWKQTENYKTEYHEYLRLDGETNKRKVTLYIPITPEYNENWVFLFEVFKETQQEENAYAVQERVMKTVALLPYYHTVASGEDLAAIAAGFTGDSGNASKLAEYKTNQAISGGQVQAGDRVEIPLGLLFQKNHYQ